MQMDMVDVVIMFCVKLPSLFPIDYQPQIISTRDAFLLPLYFPGLITV